MLVLHVSPKGSAGGGRIAGPQDVAQDAAQDLAFGNRAACALLAMPPPPPPPFLRSSRLAEMGVQLNSSVAFGSGSAQALPGVPRKAPLYLF